MRSADFMDSLCRLHFRDAFNPYADKCPLHDTPGAPKARERTLAAILQAATEVELDAIWIGRDLGYRGGRRTGLALTDDVHIHAHAYRWGVSAARPTRGQEMAERTAAVIWRVLSRIETPIFLWNVFPLHPHEPNDPFTNRSHNSAERRAGEGVLDQLIQLLRPRRLIAIGNDAAQVAQRMSTATRTVIQVRHPSYGGQTQFLQQAQNLYGLRSDKRQGQLALEH